MTKCQRQLHSTATATSWDSANSATRTYEFLVQSTGTTRADCGLIEQKRDGQREDTDARAMYNSMLELRPDVAFINVSGNDITSQTTPREIFDRVVLIVNDQAAGTSTIFVAEIMKRGDFSKSPDQPLDKSTFDVRLLGPRQYSSLRSWKEGIFQRVPTNPLISRRSTESVRKSTVFLRNDLKRILYVFLMSVIQKTTITTRSISWRILLQQPTLAWRNTKVVSAESSAV